MFYILYPEKEKISFDTRLNFELAYFNILRGKKSAQGFTNNQPDKPVFNVIEGRETIEERVSWFVSVRNLWREPPEEVVEALIQQFKTQKEMASVYSPSARERPAWTWIKYKKIPFNYWIVFCVYLRIHIFKVKGMKEKIEFLVPPIKKNVPKGFKIYSKLELDELI